MQYYTSPQVRRATNFDVICQEQLEEAIAILAPHCRLVQLTGDVTKDFAVYMKYIDQSISSKAEPIRNRQFKKALLKVIANNRTYFG